MKSENVDEKLNSMLKALGRIKPTPRQQGSPDARVLDAVQEGRELVAVKSFRAAEFSYEPGDVIQEVEGWPKGRLGLTATHGYILPGDEYVSGKKYAEYKNMVDNTLLPLFSRRDQIRTEMTKAVGEHAEFLVKVRDAEIKIEQLAGQVELQELEIDEIMAGPKIDMLLVE